MRRVVARQRLAASFGLGLASEQRDPGIAEDQGTASQGQGYGLECMSETEDATDVNDIYARVCIPMTRFLAWSATN